LTEINTKETKSIGLLQLEISTVGKKWGEFICSWCGELWIPSLRPNCK